MGLKFSMKKIKLLMNEGTTNKAILKLYVFSLNQARPILVKRRLKNFFFVNSRSHYRNYFMQKFKWCLALNKTKMQQECKQWATVKNLFNITNKEITRIVKH